MSEGYYNYLANRRLFAEQRYIECKLSFAKNPYYGPTRGTPAREKEIVELRAVYHEVPKFMEKANAGRRRVNEAGLWRLDGKIGNALRKRKLDKLLGAEYITVDFMWTSPRELKTVEFWYAPPWFCEFVKTLPNNRSKFYKRLDDIAEDGQDELDSEIGLMMLKGLP